MIEKIISFGFRHEWPPEIVPGVVVIDVRQMFRNPYRDKTLRYLRGTDPRVQEDVMRTPDFALKYDLLVKRVTAPGVTVAYIGCTGGHHRSVFLAERIGQDLGVKVEHRDIDKK